MNEELDAIEKSHTWDLVDMPKESRPWCQMGLQNKF